MVNPINPENPDSKCHETVLLYNNLPTQIGDVIVNPLNPVNPDSNYVIRKGFILRNLLNTHTAKCLKNRVNS
jgi:hypothetical protein